MKVKQLKGEFGPITLLRFKLSQFLYWLANKLHPFEVAVLLDDVPDEEDEEEYTIEEYPRNSKVVKGYESKR